jgi:endonuclease YncB( thermonuclease family)
MKKFTLCLLLGFACFGFAQTRIQFELLGPARVTRVTDVGNVQVRGVNIAKELVPYGLEIRPETVQFLRQNLVGRTVFLEFDTGQETLEKVLGYTYPFVYLYFEDASGDWLAGDKRFRQINLEALQAGASDFTDFPPNMTYRERFNQARLTARREQVGVWEVLAAERLVAESAQVVLERDNIAEIFRLAASGSPNALSVFVSERTDLSIVNEDGDTPLLVAARNNTPAMVAFLLDAGADPSVNNAQTGETLFNAASDNPNQNAVVTLLRERDVAITVDTLGTLRRRAAVSEQALESILNRPNLDPEERDAQLNNRAAELVALERRSQRLETLRQTASSTANTNNPSTTSAGTSGGAASDTASDTTDAPLPSSDDEAIQQVLDERQAVEEGRQQSLDLVRRATGNTPSPAPLLDSTIQALPRVP